MKRRGRFIISHALLCDDNWRSILPAMKDVLIVRAESRYDSQTIEYIGMSDKFEEVDDGQEAPMYHCTLTRDDNGTVSKVKWSRNP